MVLSGTGAGDESCIIAYELSVNTRELMPYNNQLQASCMYIFAALISLRLPSVCF